MRDLINKLKLIESDLGFPENQFITQKVGSATVSFQIRNDKHNHDIELASIKVPHARRGTGAGTAALEWIIDIANKMNLDIELIASSLDAHTSTRELIRWYHRYGFRDTGYSGNFAGDPIMVRPHK